MTLYRSQIRDAMVQALIASQTMAGTSVYAAKDYPETGAVLPSITVGMPAETKTSLGPNGPKFHTVTHIVALGRLKGSTAVAAEALLEQFADQIQNAVLGDIDVNTLIEEFVSVDTRSVVTAEGRDQIGEISVVFSAKFYEQFAVGVPQPLSIETDYDTNQDGIVDIKALVPLNPAS